MQNTFSSAAHTRPALWLPDAWEQALRTCGFQFASGAYRSQALRFVFVRNDPWITIVEQGDPSGRLKLGDHAAVQRLGLWHTNASNAQSESRFEIPAAAIGREAMESELAAPEEPSLLAFVNWAKASARGMLPEGWRAPERTLVESWMPAEALTVRHGALMRQGRLILDAQRWALEFPITAEIPASLASERAVCLQALRGEAQARWRMVRLLERTDLDGSGRHLACRVDLSGAPHSSLLFLIGLEALRQAVLWLIEVTDLLTDVSVTIRSLEVCPFPQPNPAPNQRKGT